MEVSFYSLDNDNNKIIYKSEYKKINNTIIFKDKSLENTDLYITIENDHLVIKRVGQVTMTFKAKLKEITDVYYKNEMGLEFNFKVKTTSIILKDNRIDLEFLMILDNEVINSHKIWIIIR